MSMTTTDRLWHDEYELADADTQQAVDHAYRAAVDSLRDNGIATSNDDRAEALVAAIMRYVNESR